jgi:hypothetical protein
MSNAEYDQKIEDATKELMESIAKGPSEAYTKWMDFGARFWHYSWGNQLLIAMQMPEATHVAGFQVWLKKFKNPVKKGQTCKIRIYVPYRSKRVDPATGEQYWAVTGFGIGCVFDISQTENPDMAPEFFTKLGDDHADLVPIVMKAMESNGIKISVDNKTSAEGYSSGGKVAYKENDPNNVIQVLVHEWAHEMNHWGPDRSKWSSKQQECHAQSISHIVCSALGIEVPFSADYIISHQNTVEDFQKELGIIQKGAKSILEKIKKVAA